MDSEGLERHIRRRISEARELAGLNKQEMAHRIGIAPSSWLAIEDGPRSLDIELLVRIADITGREFGWFFPDGLLEVDLASVLLREYPGIPASDVRQLVRLAELMYREHMDTSSE